MVLPLSMSWFYRCYVDQPSRTVDANMLENLHLLICTVIIWPDKYKKYQGLTWRWNSFQASFFNFSGFDTFESINKHSSNLRKYLCLFLTFESHFPMLAGLLWSSTAFHFIGPMKYCSLGHWSTSPILSQEYSCPVHPPTHTNTHTSMETQV